MKKHVWIVLVLAFFISIAMAGGATPLYADSSGTAVITSGQCGPNATYTLDADGVFTISGTGETYDYPVDYPEWYNDYHTQITKVVIEDGITQIGEYLFYDTPNLTSVTFAATVETLPSNAFYSCPSLVEATFLNASFDYDNIFDYDVAIKTPSAAFASEPSCTYDGEVKTPEIIAYDADGNLLDAKYTISYKNNINAGTAQAIVTFSGKYAGTQTLEFTIAPKPFTGTCSLSKTSYLYNGESKKPTVTVKDSNGTKLTTSDYSVKYSNTIKPGTAKATITFKGNYSGTKTLTYTIKKSTPKTITLSKTSYIYNGKLRKPTVTVKTSTGKVVNKSNYTVTYSNNKNAGTAKVTVKFKGDYYTGTRTKTFKIKPLKMTSSKLFGDIVTYDETYYTGKTKWPTIEWFNSSNTTKPYTKLVRNRDYTLKFTGNHKSVGAYPVTITFKGNFTGTLKKTWIICPGKPVITSLTATKSGVTVKWKKQSNVSGYIITAIRDYGGETVEKRYVVKGASHSSKTLNIHLTTRGGLNVHIQSYKVIKGKKRYSLESDDEWIGIGSYRDLM